MLARHQGHVVLLWGAIPGERVAARVERVAKGLAYADTVDVLAPSPDRRPVSSDWRCGGTVLAHVSYDRQRRVKGEIIRDAFARIGRLPLDDVPDVIGSPERGYRMRARLHAHSGRLGFYRESTHDLCDARGTGQLLDSTNAWIATTEAILKRDSLTGLAAVEIAENIDGTERACHLELHERTDPSRFAALSTGLTGLSAQRTDRPDTVTLAGTPFVTDSLRIHDGESAPALRLRRNARAFFQGNRFLLERLLHHVQSLVHEGPVVDLYAGGGLFGLALAAANVPEITLVEGDPVSADDLLHNAQPFRDRVRVERRSVESFVQSGRARNVSTMIVDPPRTGLSKDAARGVLEATPQHLVYVSCDVATLARDTRAVIDAGYQLGSIIGLDLFPNTAHVETVVEFRR